MSNQAVLHHPIPLARPDRRARGRFVRFVVDRSLLLPLGAAIAMAWANTAAESYFRFSHAIAFPVNEIAMAFSETRSCGASMPGGVSFVIGLLVAGLKTLVAHPERSRIRRKAAHARGMRR